LIELAAFVCVFVYNLPDDGLVVEAETCRRKCQTIIYYRPFNLLHYTLYTWRTTFT